MGNLTKVTLRSHGRMILAKVRRSQMQQNPRLGGARVRRRGSRGQRARAGEGPWRREFGMDGGCRKARGLGVIARVTVIHYQDIDRSRSNVMACSELEGNHENEDGDQTES